MVKERSLNMPDPRWHRPPTSIYENNYGYGIGFYQPMIDYLNAKESGRRRALPLPHIPWVIERGLPAYDPARRIYTYDPHQLRRLAEEAQERARADLRRPRDHVAPRSEFCLAAQVAAARSLSDRVLTDSVEDLVCRRRHERNLRRAESLVRELELMDFIERVFPRKDHHQVGRNAYAGKSARAIAGQLMTESFRNMQQNELEDHLRRTAALGCGVSAAATVRTKIYDLEEDYLSERKTIAEERKILKPLESLRSDLRGLNVKSAEYFSDTSKQTAIEIEQLNARVVEAETKLKTEVQRIKKKLQMQITELELSLDVANKNNIELQKTIKKQSLQLTELQAHYDETQRQLAVTLDQYGIAQRRLQSLTSELEEVRANYEQALRSKRSVEQLYEEASSRINELTTINVNLAASRAKLEQELSTLAGDYDEATKELRNADERYQRVQVELKHTVEILHEEQERIIKIETIKKSLEIEVKNLSVRLEEVEANAIVGGKRIISKLEARMRDLELELEEEKRRHAETLKILRKKERQVKEVFIQCEEDQKNIQLLQEQLDKTTQKVSIYKRQLTEQEGMSQQSVTRVRRFQRELEAAEDRAENAESNLSLIRAKHRTFVTTSTVPGSQVYMVQETRSSSEAF